MGKVRGIEVKHTTLVLADRWRHDRRGRVIYPCPCCGVETWFARAASLGFERGKGRSRVTTKACECFVDQLVELEDYAPFAWDACLQPDGPVTR